MIYLPGVEWSIMNFLDSQPGDNTTRYFIRKGSEQEELAQDLEAAKGYKWNVRVQGQRRIYQ